MSEHSSDNEINRREATLLGLMLAGAGSVASLSEAFAQGLPDNSSLIAEIEELPPYIERRHVPEGQLPEGLAMVSFTSAPLDELNLNYRGEPRRIDIPPYNGRKVAVIEGPAGEWLELIEG